MIPCRSFVNSNSCNTTDLLNKKFEKSVDDGERMVVMRVRIFVTLPSFPSFGILKQNSAKQFISFEELYQIHLS